MSDTVKYSERMVAMLLDSSEQNEIPCHGEVIGETTMGIRFRIDRFSDASDYGVIKLSKPLVLSLPKSRVRLNKERTIVYVEEWILKKELQRRGLM